MLAREDQDIVEESDEQQINEEYKIWKKNTPFLYDYVVTHVLDWPSLTVDWLPVVDERINTDYTIHKLVIGTHTSKTEQDQLIIATVKIPLEESIVNPRVYQDNTKDVGGVGLLTNTENKIEYSVKINHDGEVNRVRVMPKSEGILATKSPSGLVYVYDYTKHPKISDRGPQITLQGHRKEGYGLSWHPENTNFLASGSDDRLVCVWDIIGHPEANSRLNPLRVLSAHTNIVGDVSWNYSNPNILASVGDDRKLILWDLSQENPIEIVDAHSNEINSVDFNKFEENLLATGSKDKTVAVWDIRNMQKKLHSFEFHKDTVFNVRWSPFSGSLLGSTGKDRRVLVWDLSKIGAQQTDEEALDGPPELLFIHGGHTSSISDFSWNHNEELMMASVSEDNILQVWQMTHAMFSPSDEDLEGSDPMELCNN